MLFALDTSIDGMAAGIFSRDGTPVALVEDRQRTGQAERIARLVEALMARAQVRFDQLERIAVTTGPGSFNGVRIGLAFARGLALARSVACVGVSTLEVLAAASPGRPRGAIVVAGAAAFAGGWDGEDACVLAPAAFADIPAALGALENALGPGASVHAAPFQGAEDVPARLCIRAPDVTLLARLAGGRDPATHPPNALYLRAPYAPPP
jgi:tRNA threonylcarbamoyladenosine biosynthesis protein TsaB